MWKRFIKVNRFELTQEGMIIISEELSLILTSDTSISASNTQT